MLAEHGDRRIARLERDGSKTTLAARTLYVSNADARRPVWMACPPRPDESVGVGRVFFDATAWIRAATGNPDRMKVDVRGNLFGAGRGGLHIFAPDGTHLGLIKLPGSTSNCAWGEDGSTPFITAGASVYRVRTITRGTLPGARRPHAK